MKISETSIIALLKRYNVHVTRNRIEMLSAILSMTGTITANRFCGEAGLRSDRVTVYRTLQEFRRKGLLQLVPNTSGKIAFCMDPGLKTHSPQHAVSAWSVCTACGSRAALDLAAPVILSEMIGFDTREVLVKGLCKSCNTAH